MLFTRHFQFNCSKNAASLREHFLGRHVNIHHLDFEVYDEGDHLKVIPHTEESEQIFTLPITKIMLAPQEKGTTVRMKFSPRLIDIGGPYLLLIFIAFALISAILLLWTNTNVQAAYIIMGTSAIVFALLWYRMERGYFDYIRKLKNWAKQYAGNHDN